MPAYFDSCIVVYLVEEVQPWRDRVRLALTEVDGVEIVTSDLVRMECMVGPLRAGDRPLAATFATYLDLHECAPLPGSVFDRAARIRAEFGLRTADALHVACAIEERCDEFWTNDRRLDRLALPLKVRVFEEATPESDDGR